jgi:hypothetical protein
MKGSTSNEVFIKRAEHILTFQNKISGNLYPECFANHKSARYSSYKSRALKKQLDFLITNEDYDKIINNNCYLCGKTNDDKHKNGIDRIDNNKGYFINNVKSCCGECNFMKKDYQFDDIINKLLLIYKNHKNDIIEDHTSGHEEDKNKIPNLSNDILLFEPLQNIFISETTNNAIKDDQSNRHIVINKNKKTVEEIRENNRIYKQKQRKLLKEKYGDEEYKKLRAKEIAELRRSKTN